MVEMLGMITGQTQTDNHTHSSSVAIYILSGHTQLMVVRLWEVDMRQIKEGRGSGVSGNNDAEGDICVWMFV